MSFKGKKAVITGGSSGIGKAIAKQLASEGADVCVVGRNKERLESVCSEIGGTCYESDLSNQHDRAALCNSIDKIDILINAAGQHSFTNIAYSSPDYWRQLMEINVIAPANLLAQLIPKFNIGSSVVNIASISGIIPTARNAIYSATKAALLSFTKTSAIELAPKIRVNAILPGMVKTPMMEKMFRFLTKEQQAEIEKKHLLGFGDVEDIANMACFLVSEEAKWITGSWFVVDGGFSL